ncbi:hypothetical protein, partial [Clostridium sp.]|uniref:hypothetical protein n=1 Tax=Clostridium sp. TaxID=1506 RepID=UPI00307ADE77
DVRRRGRFMCWSKKKKTSNIIQICIGVLAVVLAALIIVMMELSPVFRERRVWSIMRDWCAERRSVSLNWKFPVSRRMV